MLTDYNEYLEGVKIWYNGTSLNWRNASSEDVTINSSQTDALCPNGSLSNVGNGGSSSYVLSGLSAYTQYDVFLMPFYKTLLGKPSNSMTGYTDEDGKQSILPPGFISASVCYLVNFVSVPSIPPQSVTASVINATSARIRWEPPPANTWNGELTGYLVSTRFGAAVRH